MRIRVGYFTPIAGSVAAAVAIAAAPIASATAHGSPPTPPQVCTSNSAGKVCQSPGNVQINDAPAPDEFEPYPGEAFLP